MVAKSGRFVVTTRPAPTSRPRSSPRTATSSSSSAAWARSSGTDLEMVLRARGIDTLVLLGIATSGVVLSTVRHAADADYQLVVVSDCCADADEEVHRVLTEKVLVRQATVATANELIEALKSAK